MDQFCGRKMRVWHTDGIFQTWHHTKKVEGVVITEHAQKGHPRWYDGLHPAFNRLFSPEAAAQFIELWKLKSSRRRRNTRTEKILIMDGVKIFQINFYLYILIVRRHL